MDTTVAEPISVGPFIALTLGIIVFIVGAKLTNRFPVLARYSIPEPVSGGLLAAVLVLIAVKLFGRQIEFDLQIRDYLLIYFFTTVGLNARVSDLLKGGPLLAIMLALTVGFMLVQTVIGIGGAALFGLPPQTGVMLGTASLIGGHGTAIAWGPELESLGIEGIAELGIAAATVGLIMASLLGGPIAEFLIKKNDLKADPEDVVDFKSVSAHDPNKAGEWVVRPAKLMRTLLWVHVAIIMGYVIHQYLISIEFQLPLFVPCLLSGIILSNTLPKLFPKMSWPTGSASLDLVAEFSLSVFLAMSLMSMELWTLSASAGVLAFTMLLQALVAAIFIIFVVFRLMGGNYFASVISAGFAGFALGATPTAIANMSAVTQRHGPSPVAFIILPLVSAFFIDIVNAFVIQYVVAFFG